MFDHATAERKEFIASVRLGVSHYDLGDRYVLHPDYHSESNPAHQYKGSYFLMMWMRDVRKAALQ